MRDEVVDIMKCVGIIAVIVGHSEVPEEIKRFIFVWHMPMFFMISGFFLKPDVNIRKILYSSFNHLVIPYVIVCTFYVIIKSVLSGCDFITILKNVSISLLYGPSLRNHDITFSNYNLSPLALWFLPALFWSRLIYSLLYKYYKNHSIYLCLFLFFLLFLSSILLADEIPFNLFAFAQGVNGTLFLTIGNYLYSRQMSLKMNHSIFGWILGIACFLVSFNLGGVNLRCCYYSCIVVNVLACVFSCFAIYRVASSINKYSERVSSFVSFFGRISIIIYCIHIFEIDFDILLGKIMLFLQSQEIRVPDAIIVLWRVVVVFMMSYVIYKAKRFFLVFTSNRLK